MIKRDTEDAVGLNDPSSSSSHQSRSWSRASRERDHGRDRRNSYSSSTSNSWRDRDERGGRERDRAWRDGEGEPGARKRSIGGYHDGRGREDRGSDDRRERKLLSPSPISVLSTPLLFFPPSFFFVSYRSFFLSLFPVNRGHRTLGLRRLLPIQRPASFIIATTRAYLPPPYVFNEPKKTLTPLWRPLTKSDFLDPDKRARPNHH